MDGLGAYEVLLQVGMDSARGVLCARSTWHSPCAAFVFADGEERNHAEQFISFTNEPRQAAVFQSVAGKKFLCFFIAHFRQFSLHLPADGGGAGVFARRNLFQSKLV